MGQALRQSQLEVVTSAGHRLREVRLSLGLSMREVEQASRTYAEKSFNPEFIISSAWLTVVENTGSVPSIFKLYFLCILYHLSFSDIMSMYGMKLDDLVPLQQQFPARQTHLAGLDIYDGRQPVQFPARFDEKFSHKTTNLVSRMVDLWGELPLGLLPHLNVRDNLFGYVGTSDSTMSPLLRAGSFVQIDSSQTSPQALPWVSEYDRPIFFIELRDGYACAWCELHGSTLFLVPHPRSGAAIRQYEHRKEAEILGKVVAVVMKLTPPAVTASRPPLQLV